MDISKFTDKFNYIEGNSYMHEEEVSISNNVYNGELEHDNINSKTLVVYTGPSLTGEKITNFFLSTPTLAPWKYKIRIYAGNVEKVYISYTTDGDQVEADDINLLQNELVRTQEAVNTEESRAVNKEIEIENNLNEEIERATNTEEELAINLQNEINRATAKESEIDTELLNRYKKDETFSKDEVMQKIADLVNSAPETLDTLQEIANALGNDPNFSTTIINLLGNKVDKEEGKVLSTNDYTVEEKQRVEIAYNSRISYIVVEGENNVFTATVEGITKYMDGLPLCIKLPIDATDICTLNLNDLGAITIQDSSNLKSNIPYNIRFEITSSSFILQTKGGGEIDVSYATASAEDILAGKIAYGSNGKLEGAMVDNRDVDITLNSNNQEYTIPKGFHNGLGKIKSVITNLIASVIKYGSVVGGITGTFTGDATATAAQMLSGAIAYVKGNKVTGAMTNQGAKTSSLNCGGSYTIPAGYHNGSGKVTANSLASQTSATATAAQISNGYTAWVNGFKLTGTSKMNQYVKGIATTRNTTINFGFTANMVILQGTFSYIAGVVSVSSELIFMYVGGNGWYCIDDSSCTKGTKFTKYALNVEITNTSIIFTDYTGSGYKPDSLNINYYAS